MLTIRKITAGKKYQYLIRRGAAENAAYQPGCTPTLGARALHGKTSGRWMGSGLVALGRPVSRDPEDPLIAMNWSVAEGSEVLKTQMKALFGEGLHPNAERIAAVFSDRGQVVAAEATRLGRPLTRRPENRPPVAGFALTFTPVKSVSVLWGLASNDLAEKIAAAHRRSVQEAVDFLEEHAAFTRMGAAARFQVDTTGLIIAAFERGASLAGDPNLHTELAVSGKVCAFGVDGVPRWLALDSKALYRSIVAASEYFTCRWAVSRSSFPSRFNSVIAAP